MTRQLALRAANKWANHKFFKFMTNGQSPIYDILFWRLSLFRCTQIHLCLNRGKTQNIISETKCFIAILNTGKNSDDWPSKFGYHLDILLCALHVLNLTTEWVTQNTTIECGRNDEYKCCWPHLYHQTKSILRRQYKRKVLAKNIERIVAMMINSFALRPLHHP